MNHAYGIRLSHALAFQPDGTRRPNAWFRESLGATAEIVADRLEIVQQLRERAQLLDSLIWELGYSWRRLDMEIPAAPEDQELAQIIKETQIHARNDLHQCESAFGPLHMSIANLLDVDPGQLRREHDAATRATALLFRAPPGHGLDAGQRTALLAVVCDAVITPDVESLGPLLEIAYDQDLLSPGLVPTSLSSEPNGEESIISTARYWCKDGKTPIKLLFDDDTYDTIEGVRVILGLNKNQFAVLAVRSQLENLDPLIGFIAEGLRQTVVSVDKTLRTAFACYVAARHGQMVQSSPPGLLEEIARSATAIRREAMYFLQIAAGTAVGYSPEFLKCIEPLRSQVQAPTLNGDSRTAGIRRYLESLQILDQW